MNSFRPHKNDALIVVDLQRDFVTGGALTVSGGDEIVKIAESYIELFLDADCSVFATRDWHPQDHCSFTGQGGPWPPHCISGTAGAEFVFESHVPGEVVVIDAGVDKQSEGYSGFENTDLNDRLRTLGVTRLFVCGLATDYCVYHTVMDAVGFGYRVVLLQDAIAAVDLEPGDGQKAIDEMKRRGVRLMTRQDFS